MHFYTKLKPHNFKTHFFVADDIPSIDTTLETTDGDPFTLFAVHPLPPSPTEEDNSKERDGDLLSVAKKIRGTDQTTIVIGDFNNVAWARSSRLFRKTLQLIDAKIGRGIYPDFPRKLQTFKLPD